MVSNESILFAQKKDLKWKKKLVCLKVEKEN